MTQAEEMAIIYELTGNPIGSNGFNDIWNNEAVRSAFIEVWYEREKRDFNKYKHLMESMQYLYNIIDQYATLDLARDGNSRYKTFEKKTLAQAIKKAMKSDTDSREEQIQQAMELAGIFNNRRKENG